MLASLRKGSRRSEADWGRATMSASSPAFFWPSVPQAVAVPRHSFHFQLLWGTPKTPLLGFQAHWNLVLTVHCEAQGMSCRACSAAVPRPPWDTVVLD